MISMSSCSDMETDFEPSVSLVTYPAPTVLSFSPQSARPGVAVTITGTNFGLYKQAAKVYFNEALVTQADIVSYSDTQMVVKVPSQATSGPLRVKVWTNEVITQDIFTVIPAAIVSSVVPMNPQPGEIITVSGSNFGSDAAVIQATIGATTAEVVSVTDTQIQLLMPDIVPTSLNLNIDGQILGPYLLAQEAQLSGTVIGHEGSWGNNPATFVTAAFDGNTSTFVDGSTATGYAGYDLGEGEAAVVTKFRYFPRTSHPGRMVRGELRGSNDPSLSSFDILYTISQTPSTSEYTEVTINSTQYYRYIYYYSPNGYCNVSELQFYGLQ